jgi:hypothetical protein
MHSFFQQNDSGQATTQWSAITKMSAGYFVGFLFANWALYQFAGVHFRIESVLFSFVPFVISTAVVLYFGKLRAQGIPAHQFSLMTLLAVTTIASVLLGALSWQRQADLEAIAKRRRLEAFIMTIIGQGTVHVSSTTLIQVKRPTFDDDLTKILRLQPQFEGLAAPITIIDLSGTRITDAGVRELRAIDSLEICSMDQTVITDASLDALKDLPKLKVLGVNSTRVTEQGLLRLSILRPQLNLLPKPNRPMNSGAATTNAAKAGEASTGKK